MKLNRLSFFVWLLALAGFYPVVTAMAAQTGPVTWGGTVSIGGGWGRMVHLTNGNWLCVNAQYPAGTNSYLRIYRSTDSCRTWSVLSEVKEAGRTLDNGELVQLPDGTVLITMRSLIDNVSYQLPVYASANNGATWVYRSNVDTSSGATAAAAKGLWEPDFWVLDDGRLVVTYSNETHPSNSQLISLRVSTDGGVTWGAESYAVNQVGGSNLRPGMSQMVRMANGKYFLVYEVVNSGNADVYCKTSDDGVTWAAGIGTKIPCQHCGPFVMSLPNGVLLVSSCENQISFSEDYGATWQLNDPGWIAPFQFTWPALYLTKTNEVGLMLVTNGVKLRFGTVAPRPAWANPFVADFNGGTDAGWARYGGNFSLSNGCYFLNDAGTTGKAMTGDGFWSDGTLEADVQVNSAGNAGLMFRTTNPDYVGPDNAMGYYVGLDTTGSVLLGRMNNAYTGLTNKSMTVATNTWYHLKVNMQGGLLSVFVDDMATPKFTRTETNFTRGQIGVRAFQCNAQFDNVTFSNAVPMELQLSNEGGQVQVSWPQTSVGVKLCTQTNLTMTSPFHPTNQPVLTNRTWMMQLDASADAGSQFFWLRSE